MNSQPAQPGEVGHPDYIGPNARPVVVEAPRVVYREVEKPVERVVERIVEKPVGKPFDITLLTDLEEVIADLKKIKKPLKIDVENALEKLTAVHEKLSAL